MKLEWRWKDGDRQRLYLNGVRAGFVKQLDDFCFKWFCELDVTYGTDIGFEATKRALEDNVRFRVDCWNHGLDKWKLRKETANED